MKKLFFLLFFSILFASDINTLLNKIEKNEDLSKKTMQESAGISYVITRYQLDMMQAKYLSDVLKHTVIGYCENRYALTDPWNSPFVPYNTVGIRVFLDNQEVTTAKYDNALFLYSKIDLTFIDHIEIYYMSPTYEFSPEPAYVIIKLYSKDAKRDEGIRTAVSYGTFKSNSFVLDYAKSKKFNIYTHFSRDLINHKKIDFEDTTLNRNSLSYHALMSVYNDTTRFLLSSIYYKQHAFLGLSIDGNIDKSEISTKYLHLGIDHKINDIYLKYSFDYTNDNSFFSQNKTPVFFSLEDFKPLYNIEIKGRGSVNTFEAVYKKNISKNKIVSGISFRIKDMKYYDIKLNSTEKKYNGLTNQHIYTAFLEDNFQYLNNSILTLGASYSYYDSKFLDDKSLFQFKLGNTLLLSKNDVLKVFYYHYEFGIPPYLISTLLANIDNIKQQKTNVFITKYKKLFNKDSLEAIFMIATHKNYLLFSKKGIKSYEKAMRIKIFNLRYHKNYSVINDFVIDGTDMIFKDTLIKRLRRIVALNTHRIDKFDLFESVVYKYAKYNDKAKDGIDLNLGVKYNVNDNLSFAIKGENLLNKRYKNEYVIFDFQKGLDTIPTPLIERRVNFTMEYLF